jgi:predicted metal-dependent phosphotriesterase family hydrolase
MDPHDSRPAPLTRREAMALIGAGAGLALTSMAGEAASLASQAGAGVSRTPVPQGAIIRTIIRDISPDTLGSGATLFHEHLSTAAREFTRDTELMIDEVRAAGQNGVACIVDGGHEDMGRYLQSLRSIGARSGVHIVASGGFYIQPRYPTGVARQTEEELVEEMLRDAQAERWGALGEIGSSLQMHDLERKVLRAVGKVHARLGLPIFTHIPRECPNCGLEQLSILEQQRVDPQKLCIGHLSNQTEQAAVETAKEVAKRGAFLGFDTVRPPAEHMQGVLRMVLAALDAGLENHILLSHDGLDEKLLARSGGPGYSMAVTVFIPQLRKAGANDAVVRKLLIENPRRFLSFVPKVTATA